MSSEYRMTARVEIESRPRWIVAERRDGRMQPTRSARVVDLRGSFANGQMLAGTGALSFEGEVLEGLRLN